MTQEVTSIDDSSAFGQMFRPTFRTYTSVGLFVQGVLSSYPAGALVSIRKQAASFEVRKATAGGLAAIKAQLATDRAGGNVGDLIPTLVSGTTFSWAMADLGGGGTLSDNYKVAGVIDALLDGDLNAQAIAFGMTIQALGIGDYIVVDGDLPKVWFGSSAALTTEIVTNDVLDPEVVMEDKPNAGGFV